MMVIMQLGMSADEAVTIVGRDVIIHADGRHEVYDLAYARMLVPYLVGERDHLVSNMNLVHFRPGMKPWLSLSVIADDGSEPNLSGVSIYSGLGSYREMGLHLSHPQALRLAAALLRPTWTELWMQQAG